MESYQAKADNKAPQRRSKAMPLLVGGAAFLAGTALTFGYVQWKSQQHQLDLMTRMVAQMGQATEAKLAVPVPAATLQPVQPAQDVTRTAAVDLTTVAPLPVRQVAAAQAATLQPSIPPALQPTVVQPAATTPAAAAQSTADKIRALVAASASAATQPAAPSASGQALPVAATPAIDAAALEGAKRLETLAIIHAGVQELVNAVVAGQYDIHTDYTDEHFSGRIHFAFVGHEEDQVELERFLANAAEEGIVAHSSSVVDGDGSVNGHILLFDLVERALENGTTQERLAGEKMRREAVALLAKNVDVGETANASGDKFYTVEPGDSLAYIALQFYGNTNDFVRIFEANRATLRTPDRISVGQRLLIPSA